MKPKRGGTQGNATLTVLLIIMLIAALTAVVLVQTRQSAGLELSRAISRASEADLNSRTKRARVYLEREVSDLIRSLLLERGSDAWALSSTAATATPQSSEVASGTLTLRQNIQQVAGELCAQNTALFLTPDSQCNREAPALPEVQLIEGTAYGWQRYRIPYAVVTWNEEKRKVTRGAFTLGVGKRAAFGFVLALDESVTRQGDPISFDGNTALEGDVYIGQVARVQGAPLIAGSLESASCLEGCNSGMRGAK